MPFIETNIRYLPTPYRCAIEMLDASPDRTLENLRQSCDAYAVTYGIDLKSDDHQSYCQSAARIAIKRFNLEQ